jgi:hypothetical protein
MAQQELVMHSPSSHTKSAHAEGFWVYGLGLGCLGLGFGFADALAIIAH